MSYGLVFCIVGKNLQEEFFFVDEFDIQCDKEDRPGNKITHDRIVQKETKSKKNEGGVQRMTDKSIRAIYDESGIGIRLREDAEFTAASHRE